MPRKSVEKRLHQIRVWWRRRKLKRAYGKIAEVEMGKRVGFTPVMKMYTLLDRDGWAELEDGELNWRDERVRY